MTEPLNAEQERMLTKIEALLRKAESTKFPAEAEALTAKAEELMQKWRIDSAVLRAAQEAIDPTSHVGELRIVVWKSAMQNAQSTLLETLIWAHGCEGAYVKRRQMAHPSGAQRAGRVYTILGMPEDLQAVEMLYASLQLQATKAYASPETRDLRIAQCGTGASAGGKAIRFKNSWMVGYADRIGQRLAEIRRQQSEQVSSSTALVLFDEAQAVKRAAAERWPKLARAKASQGGRGGGGWASGYEAGGRARLGSEIQPG